MLKYYSDQHVFYLHPCSLYWCFFPSQMASVFSSILISPADISANVVQPLFEIMQKYWNSLPAGRCRHWCARYPTGLPCGHWPAHHWFSQRTFANPIILHPLKPEKRSTLELPFMLFAALHFVIDKKLSMLNPMHEMWSSVCKIVNRSPSRKVSCRHKSIIVLIFFIDAQLVELQCATPACEWTSCPIWMSAPLSAFPGLTVEVTNPVNGISHPQYIPTSGSVTEKDLSWIFILKPFFILVEKFWLQTFTSSWYFQFETYFLIWKHAFQTPL